MQIAVVTLDGFNELDSFVAAAILNRMAAKGWAAHIVAPTPEVTSMNGVTVRRQRPLDFVGQADAVLIGSGTRTREHAEDGALMAALRLDPARQLIGAQCSGTLLLAKLGLLAGRAASTDLTTRPWLEAAGLEILDTPFIAHANIATAGGCLASQYMAAWMIARGASVEDAASAIHYVAPVGEKADHVARTLSAITPFLHVEGMGAI